MPEQFRIKGLDEVIRRMRNIKNRMVSSDINIAALAGVNVIKSAAIENAKQIDDPETSEKIWQNIAVKVRKSRSGTAVIGKIGIRGGAKSGKKEGSSANPGGDTRHWRQIEFCNSKNPAQPFMRRALSENTAQATDAVVKSLSDTVDRLSK